MTPGSNLAHHAAKAVLAGLIVFQAAGCGMFGPPQPIFTAKGTVEDPEGRAVPGAVVTDGQGSTLTDEAGRFVLPVFEKALSVAKPGHATARVAIAEGAPADVVLEPSASKDVVALDTRWASKDLSGLRGTLKSAAGTLTTYPGTSLGKLDVLVMVTPGAIPASERAAIAGWVHGGGRLVLCAEWGGYPDQDLGTLNALAEPAGLGFSGGTVRVTDGPELALSVARATPASLAEAVGDAPISLYAASDVKVSGAARPILASGSRAYTVLARDDAAPTLAAVGPAGLGKVFAIGDSSLWRDEDSEGRGVPNLRHGGNARLAAALLGW